MKTQEHSQAQAALQDASLALEAGDVDAAKRAIRKARKLLSSMKQSEMSAPSLRDSGSR